MAEAALTLYEYVTNEFELNALIALTKERYYLVVTSTVVHQ